MTLFFKEKITACRIGILPLFSLINLFCDINQYQLLKDSESVSGSLPFTFSVPKPYGFRTKNIRFWDGERTVNHKKIPSKHKKETVSK